MSQTVLIKRSSVAAKVPTTAQLSLGELALNTYDGKLYLKKNVLGVESVVEVGAITVSGDATGSGNGSITLTLANSGVAAGTYPKVTVDAKGRVTSGASLAASDIPALDWSKITSGKPTTLAGYGITNAAATDSIPTFSGGVGGVEGGEIHLAKAPSSTSVTTDSVIDVYDSKIRFFELGGTNRGAYLDLAECPAIGGAAIAISTTASMVNPATPKDGDVKVASGVISIYASGAWKQVFPAVYA